MILKQYEIDRKLKNDKYNLCGGKGSGNAQNKVGGPWLPFCDGEATGGKADMRKRIDAISINL